MVMADLRKVKPAYLKIEAIRCDHCGRIGLAVNDERITDHKCFGAWTVIAEVVYHVNEEKGCEVSEDNADPPFQKQPDDQETDR